MKKIEVKNKVAVIVSTPSIIREFLIKHLEVLSINYDVTVIFNEHDYNDKIDFIPKNINTIHIPISRKIKLLNDLYVSILLFRLLKKNKFYLVFSVSPKAGFLSMTTSFMAGIPNRIHYFTGQVWSSKRGLYRLILKMVDRLTAICSTNILIDSFSQKKFLIHNGIVNNNSIVINNGSISGVDFLRFFPSKKNKLETRKELMINNDELVFLFLGRLNKEKGIKELCEAFKRLKQLHQNVYLLVIGKDEENLKEYIETFLKAYSSSYTYLEYTKTPEKFLQMADVLCLPSYREGFGNVVIEAAACGIPTIGSNIYGLSDAIENNVTGILYDSKSIEELFLAMQSLIIDDNKRYILGQNAFDRTKERYSQNEVIQGFSDTINELLNE